MVLKLEIVQTPQGVNLVEAEKTISEQGGSIGRGENNTWVLADPERFLSSRHCEVTCEAEQFFLVDTSTNGTFYNGAPEPVGRGTRVALKDGDSFEVGDYKFVVSMQGGGADAFGGALLPLDPFDVPPSPFDEPAKSPGASSIDDFLDAPLQPVTPLSLGGDLDTPETDPLAALDKVAPQSDPFSVQSDPFAMPSAQAGAESYPYGQNSFGQDGDVMSGSFAMPEPKQPSGAIPEDWEEDWLSSPPGHEPPPASVAPSVLPEPSRQPPPIETLQGDESQYDYTSEPPVKPTLRPGSAGARARASIDAQAPERRDISQPNPVAQGRARPIERRARPPESPARNAVLKEAAATCKILLESMGLDPAELSPQQQQAITRQVGELLPVIIQGMMNVLRSRASIKNEFRMSVTTIQPVENNPLKFSADTQEAVENMFVRESKAYKGPVEAFTEGFDAIAEHQIAIIAGIRAAFSSMFDQFDPATLEKQFDKQSKGVVLPGMQKAKYWTSYTEFYVSAMDNIEQSFQNLFGDEFVRAYEDQLFKLVSARNQKK